MSSRSKPPFAATNTTAALAGFCFAAALTALDAWQKRHPSADDRVAEAIMTVGFFLSFVLFVAGPAYFSTGMRERFTREYWRQYWRAYPTVVLRILCWAAGALLFLAVLSFARYVLS